MKKNFLLSIFILTSLFLHAQTQSGNVNDLVKSQKNQDVQTNSKNHFQKENLRFGGSFGASFGEVMHIDISPEVGYQFYPRFQAGMGIIYNYYANNYYTPRLSMHIFGVSPYAEFVIIKRFLFLRAEYGLLNYNTNFYATEPKREWVGYPLVGGGIFLPIGPNGGISILALWNLNYDKETSIYGSNPIIRMGCSFGL